MKYLTVEHEMFERGSYNCPTFSQRQCETHTHTHTYTYTCSPVKTETSRSPQTASSCCSPQRMSGLFPIQKRRQTIQQILAPRRSRAKHEISDNPIPSHALPTTADSRAVIKTRASQNKTAASAVRREHTKTISLIKGPSVCF